MNKFWVTELWRVAGYLLPALFLGWIFNAVFFALFIGLAFFAIYHYRQFLKVYRWLGESLTSDINVSGMWEELVYRIYRKRKRSRSRKKSLSSMLRRFQDSVSMMPDAAIVLDKENAILWINPAAKQMLHLSSKDVGNNLGNLIRTPAFIRFLNISENGEAFEMQSPLDQSQTLDMRLMPYGEGQRLLLIRNVTQLQRLKAMRQDFVANVSHELRTPLTVILGYLESLQDIEGISAEEMLQHIQKLYAPANRMNQIVQDLLLLSRLDMDIPSDLAETPTIDLSVMLAMIKKDGEQLSDGRHQVVFNNQEPAKLKGIENEIYSAVSNLVSNAVRYSPDGGKITIETSADDRYYRISVIDDGLGIAPEHISRLTERFYRVDAGRSREVGGTGLGLAIVKQILRRHDARLDIESSPGKGSCFSCVFPLSRVALETAASA